jgi:hypothetical protein
VQLIRQPSIKEARYCHSGIGVEFIGLSPEAKRDIAAELALNQQSVRREKKARVRSRSSPRR